MGMFGANTTARASPISPSPLRRPLDEPLQPMQPEGPPWSYHYGLAGTHNGRGRLGYDPPLTPSQTSTAAPQPGPLSQRCLSALLVTHKSPSDVARVTSMMPIFREATAPFSVDPHLLAAIALRETGGKNIAEIGKGVGMGVFQLTNRPGVTKAQAYDIPFAAGYAAKMLAQNRDILSRRAPNFTRDQLTQAIAAAYNKGGNKGRSRITSDPRTNDIGTTRNYGRNVFDLMDCF